MQRGFNSGPAAPVGFAISEPPIAPVALSFDSSPETLPSPAASRPRPGAPSAARLLSAWAVDLALLSSLFAGNVLFAARSGRQDCSEVLAGAAWLWIALLAVLAVAWSWVFIAFCGRTPGMAVTGQRLQTLQGGRPAPARAFVRAVLAVGCAVPGLFGFVLALFDPRGQTLHDKLSRCLSVVDGVDRRR